MTNLLPLFTANLLPILLTAGFGFLLSRYVEIDPKTVSCGSDREKGRAAAETGNIFLRAS
jgi:hypothetical protein